MAVRYRYLWGLKYWVAFMVSIFGIGVILGLADSIDINFDPTPYLLITIFGWGIFNIIIVMPILYWLDARGKKAGGPGIMLEKIEESDPKK